MREGEVLGQEYHCVDSPMTENRGGTWKRVQRIQYHFVFNNAKFDLQQNARLVSGGNWHEMPREGIYSEVVRMITIGIDLTLDAMNGLIMTEQRKENNWGAKE